MSIRSATAASAFVVISLALGVGANTAMFSVVYHVLLRPLPFLDSGRLVLITERALADPDDDGYTSSGFFLDLRDRATRLSAIAAFENVANNYALTGVPEPERLHGTAVTPSLFTLLGVTPVVGRSLVDADEQPGAPRVAVLSHELWSRKFAGAADVIGRGIRLNGQLHTVVGVMPPSLVSFPYNSDVWVPLSLSSSAATNFRSQHLKIIARLKDDVSLNEARDEVRRRHEQAVAVHAELVQLDPRVEGLQDHVTAPLRRSLPALFATTMCLLVICCTNISTLISSEWEARKRELSLRLALGATPGQTFALVAASSVVWSLIGGLASVAIGYGVLRVVVALLPAGVFGAITPSMSTTVLVFAVVLTGLASMAPALVAWLRVVRTDIVANLRGAAVTDTGPRAPVRRALLGLQIAMAVMLTFGTLQLGGDLRRVSVLSAGLHADDVLVFKVLSSADCLCNSSRSSLTYQQDLADRLRLVPGVTAAAVVGALPVRDAGPKIELAAEHAPASTRSMPLVSAVSPDYFKVIGVQVIAGRVFTRDDRLGGTDVAVVSQSLGRRLWGPEAPVGRRIRLNPDSNTEPWLTVIGVVADIPNPATGMSSPVLYLDYDQDREPAASTFVVRTDGHAMRVVPSVVSTVKQFDKALPVWATATFEQLLFAAVAPRRLMALFSGAFGLLAVVLAAVGVFGLTTEQVVKRRREVAVRIALGAQSSDVMLMYTRDMIPFAVVSVGVGGLGAAIASRVIEVVRADDVIASASALAATVAILLAVIAVSATFPIVQTRRLDIASALRDE